MKNRDMLSHSSSKLKIVGILTLVSVLMLHQFFLLKPFSTKAEVACAKGNEASASGQCLNLNQDLDSLVANANQIFVTMPAKAGGTSMKDFTSRCNKIEIKDNVLARPELQMKKILLGNSLHVQHIITSHLYTDENLIDLTKYPTRETLMIYIHREETSRVLSGIQQVSQNICNFLYGHANQTRTRQVFKMQKNKTHCILDEEALANAIAARTSEVGFATHDILTCRSYKSIQENAPQLVFLHYKQVDKLQAFLAKHHCPEMLDQLPIKSNVAEDKPVKVLVNRATNNINITNAVDIEEWLHAKAPALEWTLKLRRSASCQAKTTHMENELFNCPSEVLRVTPESIDRW
jgi:hypothetical protein